MSRVKITLDELMNELDKFRTSSSALIIFTKKQDEFIIKARNHYKPLGPNKISLLFKKTGFNISQAPINRRIQELKAEGKIKR